MYGGINDHKLLGESGKLFLVIGHKISVWETQQVTNSCTQFATLYSYEVSGAIRTFSHNAEYIVYLVSRGICRVQGTGTSYIFGWPEACD